MYSLYICLYILRYIYIYFPILHLGYFSERKSPSYKSDAMIQLGGKRDIISTRRTFSPPKISYLSHLPLKLHAETPVPHDLQVYLQIYKYLQNTKTERK